MAVMAKWRNKAWKVTPDEIKTITGLSLGYKIKAENNEDLEYTPATNERGLEPASLKISTAISTSVGVDVRSEIDEWKELVEKTGYFYLAGKNLGPYFQLQGVDVSTKIIDDFGNIRVAELALSFLEHSNDLGEAVVSGPTIADKERLKPLNVLLKTSAVTGFKPGTKVQVVGERYATGETIPGWVKESKYTIAQVSAEKVLVQPINSWVYVKDLTLIM